MVNFGQFNFLKIVRKTGRGTFLAGGSSGELFLPKGQTPDFCEAGDKIEVFVYRNSDNEAVATTKRPRAALGSIACLEVVSVNNVGAFLDWGLPKDLFAPFGQQAKKMETGERHIVAVYEDNTGRIAASSKLNRFVKPESKNMRRGQLVEAIVGEQTDLGFKMIINSKYWGILHKNDVLQAPKYGKKIKAYIKTVRPDGRLDISLTELDSADSKVSLQSKIITLLKDNHGFYEINDKTSPEIIYKHFEVSKKVFKATLGNLYKKKIISFENNGIKLIKK
ncbi:MAG: CvfB family protein [Kangiellaceae bacterium]